MSIACTPEYHRHRACARCGAVDATVAETVTRDGRRWDPLCSECSRRAIKAERIRAVERVEAQA